MSDNGDEDNNDDITTFKMANTKLCVPIVILTTEDIVKLTKQLSEGFKRSVYQNQYKKKLEPKELDNNNPIRISLHASFQGIQGLLSLLRYW